MLRTYSTETEKKYGGQLDLRRKQTKRSIGSCRDNCFGMVKDRKRVVRWLKKGMPAYLILRETDVVEWVSI